MALVYERFKKNDYHFIIWILKFKDSLNVVC